MYSLRSATVQPSPLSRAGSGSGWWGGEGAGELRDLGGHHPRTPAQYLQIRFQGCPHIPVMQGGSLAQVHLDPLLSFCTAQSWVGLGPGDVQDRLMHIHGPEVASGLRGVGGELPPMLLLVVAQLVDGPPQTSASYACLTKELRHRLQVAHDGVACVHPAWGHKGRGEACGGGTPKPISPHSCPLCNFLTILGAPNNSRISVLIGEYMAFFNSVRNCEVTSRLPSLSQQAGPPLHPGHHSGHSTWASSLFLTASFCVGFLRSKSVPLCPVSGFEIPEARTEPFLLPHRLLLSRFILFSRDKLACPFLKMRKLEIQKNILCVRSRFPYFSRDALLSSHHSMLSANLLTPFHCRLRSKSEGNISVLPSP